MPKAILWFSDFNKIYDGSDPYFYPVEKIELAQELERCYELLKAELKVIWETSDNITAFKNYDSFDDKQFPSGSWKKIVFKVWGLENKRALENFPATSTLIKKFPSVSSCFLTKTSAHSVIRLHSGETNAHLRIHLGLHVPQVDANICGMEVGTQTIGWQNGKTFAFLDAHSHHVWNNSNEERYVLIVDLIRPEFLARQKFVCARVIVSQLYFYSTSLIGVKWLYKMPAKVLDIFTYLSYVPLQIAIEINSKYPFVKL